MTACRRPVPGLLPRAGSRTVAGPVQPNRPLPACAALAALAAIARRVHHAAAAVLAALCLGALPPQAAAADAPPARAGQLAFYTGGALMRVQPEAAWEPAWLNLPLAAGMGLGTDLSARLEARIGSAALRLGWGSAVQLTELDDQRITVDLLRGKVSMRLRTLAPGEVVGLSANGVRVELLSPGIYRASYQPRDQQLRVQVFEGQAKLLLAGQERTIGPAQHAVADTTPPKLLELGASDERIALDEFSLKRDRRSEAARVQSFLPAEMTGADALEGHGTWRQWPGVGWLWFPHQLASDWAPYRVGRWRWLTPWGWTWVDDAPWGFAPFHYGRWLFAGGRWAWSPGQLSARVVFAPALVGFYGGPDGAPWQPVPDAPALVGWYPLAPNELYWPAYSNHLPYVRALNAAHLPSGEQINSLPDPAATGPTHRHAHSAFAATAMPQAAFQAQQAVAPSVVPLPPTALARPPLAARRAPPAWVAPPAQAAASTPELPPKLRARLEQQALKKAARQAAKTPPARR